MSFNIFPIGIGDIFVNNKTKENVIIANVYVKTPNYGGIKYPIEITLIKEDDTNISFIEYITSSNEFLKKYTLVNQNVYKVKRNVQISYNVEKI